MANQKQKKKLHRMAATGGAIGGGIGGALNGGGKTGVLAMGALGAGGGYAGSKFMYRDKVKKNDTMSAFGVEH